MSTASTTLIAAFLTGLAGFGTGYMMAPQPARYADTRPIVDPDAWNRPAPGAASFQAQATQAAVGAASVSQVSAKAMPESENHWDAQEAAYSERYADEDDAALVALSNSDASGSFAIEPLEGAGGEKGNSTIMVLSKADADRMWDETSPPPEQQPPAPETKSTTTP